MISIKINLDKMDPDKLYGGRKGKYLNAVLIPTPNSECGDFMIVQETSKEEREAGKRGAILGNGKQLHSRKADSGATAELPKAPKPDDDSDSVPF